LTGAPSFSSKELGAAAVASPVGAAASDSLVAGSVEEVDWAGWAWGAWS
jgi:hypothetical protein